MNGWVNGCLSVTHWWTQPLRQLGWAPGPQERIRNHGWNKICGFKWLTCIFGFKLYGLTLQKLKEEQSSTNSFMFFRHIKRETGFSCSLLCGEKSDFRLALTWKWFCVTVTHFLLLHCDTVWTHYFIMLHDTKTVVTGTFSLMSNNRIITLSNIYYFTEPCHVFQRQTYNLRGRNETASLHTSTKVHNLAAIHVNRLELAAWMLNNI